MLEEESLYERFSALKDMIPPSARRTVTSSVSSLTSLTKASLSFSGKALWVISTSAFLVGVPWALAYAEEEQYVQMEREQGMIKGANEVGCSFVFFYCALGFSGHIAGDVDLRHEFFGFRVSLAPGDSKIFVPRLQRG